jgi:TolB protein
MMPKLAVFFLAFAFALVEVAARAQSPSASAQPDESALGTVEVNGSAGGWGGPPPPKLAVIPLVTQSNADSVVQLVVKRDVDLSGEYEVVDDSIAPPGPWTMSTPIDWKPWQDKKVEVLLRVRAVPPEKAGGKITLVGEVFLAPPKPDPQKAAKSGAADAAAPDADAPPPKVDPAATVKVEAGASEVRAAAHRLVDQLLGALTGKPGGFASLMTYAERVGKWRRVMVVDSDGFNLHTFGPSNATALSPVFGPGGDVFYTISEDFHRFKIVHGANAAPLPMQVPGSILGISFSPDRKGLALAAFEAGNGVVYASSPMGAPLRAVSDPKTQPLANHPAFGPLGKVAYVAGRDAQRVYVDGKAISPGGFMASSPTFCDTDHGLLVVFTVGFGAWSDVVAIDSNGGPVRRLTQGMGANSSATCSPDGRLVAFFSNRGQGSRGAGLYMVPINRPWLVKKVSGETGEWLRWDPIATPAK